MTAIVNSSISDKQGAALDQDEPLFEIIDGERVELPPMSILSTRIAARLLRQLGHYLTANPAGEALPELLVRLPLPGD